MDAIEQIDHAPVVLRMNNISKRFRNTTALEDVGFELREGEVLALVGENGAGKSTLMKILSGAYQADEGTVEVFGETIGQATPQKMLDLGVAVIYQELLLAKDLTVAENIFLGRMPRTRLGTIDWRSARQTVSDTIERLGFNLNPDAKVADLSVAHRQIVEIAKAISRNARIIVMDEPSAVLGDHELEKLFAMMKRLSKEGVSFIYISHRLEEIFAIADNAVVLRDGKLIGSKPTSKLSKDALIKMMVGRELSSIYPQRVPRIGAEALAAENITNSRLKGVSLRVRKGEILGVCGLAGAGRTELLRALCGADSARAEVFSAVGLSRLPRSPKQALRQGIGMLPEDRRHQGLFVEQSVAFNVAVSSLEKIGRRGILSSRRERAIVENFIAMLQIKTPGTWEKVGNLSGGNQQKCVLAKLLHAECDVLLIDEPTRGVDIGAKREIYQVLAELADKKAIAIIMVSSELPEIIGLCDRVLVMRGGQITGEFHRGDISERQIMQAATA